MIFYTDPDYLDQGFLGECSEVSKLCAQIGANSDNRRPRGPKIRAIDPTGYTSMSRFYLSLLQNWDFRVYGVID